MVVDIPILPAHIEDTVQSIASLHAEHYQQATPLQRLVDRVTVLVGRPSFVGLLTAGVVGWVLANLATAWLGHEPVDPPPFYWLQDIVGLMALYITVLILTTQRREDQLGGTASNSRWSWPSWASRSPRRSSSCWKKCAATIRA